MKPREAIDLENLNSIGNKIEELKHLVIDFLPDSKEKEMVLKNIIYIEFWADTAVKNVIVDFMTQ